MKHLTERVPFKVAKKLKDVGYPQCQRDNQYAGPKYTLDGQFTTAPFAEHYAAPTYAEALDWLYYDGFDENLPNYKDWFDAMNEKIEERIELNRQALTVLYNVKQREAVSDKS